MCVCPPPKDLPFIDVLSISQQLGEHSTHNIICINGLYITSNIYIYSIYIFVVIIHKFCMYMHKSRICMYIYII